MSRRRTWITAAAVAGSTLLTFGPAANAAGSGGSSPAAVRAAVVSSTSPSRPETATKTVTRANILPDGKQQVVEQRKVTVSVSATAGLQTLQQINVTWKGAQPSNYIDPNPNSTTAATLQEYPMVLLECRGVDSTKVPVAQRLSPDTCWTQYSLERNASSPGTAFPPWRLDRYAGTLPAYVNLPKPLPSGCSKSTLGDSDYYQPLTSPSGQKYYGGPIPACSELSPEQSNTSASFPDNSTFGVTDANGSGLAKFVVWSNETNATLGCSDTVKCSLVAIPIVGISCDERARKGVTSADTADCTYADSASGSVENGSSELSNPGPTALQAVNGALWWSASNWRNRISIPLTFAQSSGFCSVVGKRTSVFVYGSELMSEAAQQWSPTFCTDSKLSPFTQIPQAEPASVNELGERSIDAAFDTYPPPPAGKSGPPIVNAPVAVNGFAIATVIDDAEGHEVFDVRLDARLLAKLLTESYPDFDEIARNDGVPAGGSPPGPMANNPLDITEDPEFRALNPDIPAYAVGDIDPRATLMALSSNSDVMEALTSYINADPAARAFIEGKPDPWGMVVNPAYKGTSLPTDFWQLKDTYLPIDSYNADPTSCFAQPEFQTPYLPLVAAPLLTLSSIAFNLEFGLPNSTTTCSLGAVPAADKLTTAPRQIPGSQFLMGIVSLSEAKRYDLDTASLESQSSVAPGAKFTSASGSTFVTPTTQSMKLAVKALKPDPPTDSYQLDYDTLRNSAAEKDAYPGTMLTSMSVPTAGLAPQVASAYSQLLGYAAGPGQSPGSKFGQLPPGYLPMTAANGLGAEASYTSRAAAAVRAQQCRLPSLAGSGSPRSKWTGCPAPVTTPSPTPTPTVTASTSADQTTGSSSPATQESLPPVGSESVSPAASSSAVAPSVAPTEPSSAPVAAITPTAPVGPLGTLLPILLLVGVVAGGAALTPNLRRRWLRGRGQP